MMDKYYLYLSENVRPGQTDPLPGISIYEMNRRTGEVAYLEKFPCRTNSNVSCVDNSRNLLYVTTEEVSEAARRANGARILTLKIDPATGHLTQLAETPTVSPNPAYITLDHAGEYAIVANHTTHNFIYKIRRCADGTLKNELVYDDATVNLYRLKDDGSVDDLVDVAIQDGSGPLKTQTHAHPHSAVVSPDGKLIAVCDKGADKVYMYHIEREHHRLVQAAPPYSAAAGVEPRFCAFHPTHPFFYINHEGDLGVEAFSYDAEGNLTHLQTISAVPKSTPLRKGVVYEHQGIAIHPSGSFLYSVTRGVDGVAAFRIDTETGLLERMQHIAITGQWPRCCQMSPDGNWLLAGCREGDNQLVVYRIGENGKLTEQQIIQNECGVSYISFF